jgi:uncharacterized membrane protein YqaE (UPF0057 family)
MDFIIDIMLFTIGFIIGNVAGLYLFENMK